MPFAEIRPTTGYCEYFENGIKNSNQYTEIRPTIGYCEYFEKGIKNKYENKKKDASRRPF
jgi:hypothetical protein